MRLALFEPSPGSEARLGVVTDQGIVDASTATTWLNASNGQQLMVATIDNFDALRPELERLAASASAVPADSVRVRPPLPRPGKIINCIANYWEHDQREPRALNMFLKNPDAVIGHGDTIVLPECTEQPIADGPGPYVFQHEAELGS